MLNGNAWTVGSTIPAGGPGDGGASIDMSVTFPDVTIGAGSTADLSFAGKVEGVCWTDPEDGEEPDQPWSSFYAYEWIDGTQPIFTPAPCFLGGDPACNTPFPNVYERWAAGGHPADLDSQQVAQLARWSTTYRGPPVVQTKDVCYWGSLACSVGTPTCTTGIGVVFVPVCPAYVKANYLVINGSYCLGIHELTPASGPGPCD